MANVATATPPLSARRNVHLFVTNQAAHGSDLRRVISKMWLALKHNGKTHTLIIYIHVYVYQSRCVYNTHAGTNKRKE
jgi:hypothetical protein